MRLWTDAVEVRQDKLNIIHSTPFSLSISLSLLYTGRIIHKNILQVSCLGVLLPLWCDITRTIDNVVLLMS